MACVYRYRSGLLKRLQELAAREVAVAKKDYGVVGDGATIIGVPKIVDVNIGPASTIDSAQSLVNGTILSETDAATQIGDAVIARTATNSQRIHVGVDQRVLRFVIENGGAGLVLERRTGVL